VKKKPQSCALYPGSFDPVTRGHLDVISRAGKLFERLYIGVIANPTKTPLFGIEERVELIRQECGGSKNVEAVAFDDLAVHAAARVGAGWIVRGVRSAADSAYEIPRAHSNRLCGEKEIETLLLPASSQVAFISSTLVRQIAAGKGSLSSFVTAAVEEALRRKFH